MRRENQEDLSCDDLLAYFIVPFGGEFNVETSPDIVAAFKAVV